MNAKNSPVVENESLELTDTELENVRGGRFHYGFGSNRFHYGFGGNGFSFGNTNQSATAFASYNQVGGSGGSGNNYISASATNYYTFIYAPSFTFNR